MPDIDSRLVNPTETQTDIANATMQKIEQAIFEKYHVSITECRKDTYKLDAVLREVFGAGHIVLEKIILENVSSLEQSKEMDKEWMTIHDKSLTTIILDNIVDKDKKRILAVSSDSHIIALLQSVQNKTINIPQEIHL